MADNESSTATATTLIREFGVLPDGRPVPAATLENANGVRATVLAYGATLQSLILPDPARGEVDVALGHGTLDAYAGDRQFFGATVGRFANRLAGGRFTLDGITHQTACNEGTNALHGGPGGFDTLLWDVAASESGETASVTLRHVSPHWDQGYPGTLTVEATYALDAADTLTITYVAVTDRPTIVNITNHAYWNLCGEDAGQDAMGHVVRIPAETFLPTTDDQIPSGELRAVAGTPFDFRIPTPIGARIRNAHDDQIVIGRGYDHNWVLTPAVTEDEHLMASVRDPVSGRGFELWSNQPGLQFYSGNVLDATTRGKGGKLYRMGDGIALEPQIFPDSPNKPGFPNAVLRPGETYRNVIRYRFRTAGGRP